MNRCPQYLSTQGWRATRSMLLHAGYGVGSITANITPDNSDQAGTAFEQNPKPSDVFDTTLLVDVVDLRLYKPYKAPGDFIGVWDTGGFGGNMTLKQSGSAVTGTYDLKNGKIAGAVSGGKLIGTWKQDKAAVGNGGRR